VFTAATVAALNAASARLAHRKVFITPRYKAVCPED
jgi:hypothetical protein